MNNTVLIKTIISTVVVIIVYPGIRFIIYKIIDKVAKLNLYNKSRSKTIKKVVNLLSLFVIATILISIWGVDTKNLLVAFSSIFAVIGVALFAQWSILSNVTAGMIMFFSSQFKIGDKIKIYDKDFPIEATVIDMKAFYVYLETDDGEKITYPNNMILQKGISVCKSM
ncbi:MAG: mechanosensitive ion channel family protein [Tannerella sp.]|jgi:small-conductance mechanosensitive channel|nr:mechanosensitive ion channel family protein [Tannerella sp.]